MSPRVGRAVLPAKLGHLPATALARRDKTLSPVTSRELTAILQGSDHTPAALKERMRQAGEALVRQGLLFWTEGVEEHCEVLIDNEKSDTYRVRVVVVLPKRPTYDDASIGALQRAAAVHELMHAVEVASWIGGPENLGTEVPKVRQQGKVLQGVQLQWSKLPGSETGKMVDDLVTELESLIQAELEKGVAKNQIDFTWSHYMPRLQYAQTRQHEVPSVIVQLAEDIAALDELDLLRDTGFYRTLMQSRDRIMEAL